MNIALLGCGVVGGGVLEIADKRADMSVKYVLVRRDKPELGEKAVKDINIILNDKEVDTVVEVMGGLSPAFEYVAAAMKAGKNVVTANKQLVAEHGLELFALAKANGVNFLFEASVAGGIPVLNPMTRCLGANEITEVSGILNGTEFAGRLLLLTSSTSGIISPAFWRTTVSPIRRSSLSILS